MTGSAIVGSQARRGRLARMIIPAAIMVLVMAGSKLLYNLSWTIPAFSLHRAVAFVLGLTLNFSITFGASFIYPITWFRGARGWERAAACLATPVLWNLWEIFRVREFFSPGESWYYGLNSLFLGAVAFTVFQMGFWELICRVWAKRRGLKVTRVWSPGPALAMAAGAAGVFVFNLWGLGAHWFYLYGQVYTVIFH